MTEQQIELPLEAAVIVTAHNDNNHRCYFVGPSGVVNKLDDDTAAIFYSQPKFYSHTYDFGSCQTTSVDQLQWCTNDGTLIGGVLGDTYVIGE